MQNNGGKTMRILPAFAVGLAAYVIGMFCISQIIGNLQNIKNQGTAVSVLAVIVWVLLMAAGYFLTRRFLPARANDYLMGIILSFVLLLRPRKTK